MSGIQDLPRPKKAPPAGGAGRVSAIPIQGLNVTTMTALPRLDVSVSSVAVVMRDASIEWRSTRYALAFSARWRASVSRREAAVPSSGYPVMTTVARGFSRRRRAPASRRALAMFVTRALPRSKSIVSVVGAGGGGGATTGGGGGGAGGGAMTVGAAWPPKWNRTPTLG